MADKISRRSLLAAPVAPLLLSAQSGSREKRLSAPLPKTNGLNLVVIVADTTRCDHLGPYGSKRVKTPSLDRLASEGVVFENSYSDGLPTIPCRRVFQTGRSILHEKQRWWRPLNADDVTLAEVLQKAGVRTGLIADTFHYFKPDMNFHRGFDSWQWIRGQETDAWINGPRERFDPGQHMPAHLMNERYRRDMLQYMLNTSMRKGEDDYFCAQSCRAAMDWLERSARNKPFFLWLDMFDPHEPWDAPPRFQKMYRQDYGYERYLFGYGVRNDDIRESDYPVLGDLYAAEVTFSDYWIGRLIGKIDSLGMRDDTIVVFASDHGTHLGEQNCVQKTAGLLNSAVAHIPLIVRHPERKFAGRKVKGFVSAIDYMPTFLGMLGIPEFPGVEGKSFWAMAERGVENYQRTFIGFGDFAAIRDKKWHYFQHFRGKSPGKGPALYDLEADPAEANNVASQNPKIVAEMRERIEDRVQAKIPKPELS